MENHGSAEADGTPLTTSSHSFEELSDVSDCPPSDAEAVNQAFYVCHTSNPPGKNDLMTAAQRGVYRDTCECLRRSNSILADLEDAKAYAKRYPGRFKYISKGNVGQDSGKVKHTPRGHGIGHSHHSFWACDSLEIHALFTQVVA